MLAVGGLLGLQLCNRFVSGWLVSLRLLLGFGKGAFKGLDIGCPNYARNRALHELVSEYSYYI